jgi:hypothetical protein
VANWDKLDRNAAHRHHDGQLTSDEFAEYEAIVSAPNGLAVLQAKARSVLNRAKAP